jgi:hypothetical protein
MTGNPAYGGQANVCWSLASPVNLGHLPTTFGEAFSIHSTIEASTCISSPKRLRGRLAGQVAFVRPNGAQLLPRSGGRLLASVSSVRCIRIDKVAFRFDVAPTTFARIRMAQHHDAQSTSCTRVLGQRSSCGT